MRNKDILAVMMAVCVLTSAVVISGATSEPGNDPNEIILPPSGWTHEGHEILTFPNVDAVLKGGVDDTIFSGLKRFGSYQEVVDYLDIDPNEHNYQNYYYRNGSDIMWDEGVDTPMVEFDIADSSSLSAAEPSFKVGGSDYSSNTNNQVSGVDEGDIIKNDGEFAYIVSEDRASINILDLRNPEEARVISIIRSDTNIVDMYVVEDNLVIIGQCYLFETGIQRQSYQYSNQGIISIQVMELNNRINITELKNETLKGQYTTSRVIDDRLHIISTISGYSVEKEEHLPIPANCTYYIEDEEPSRQFTSFMTMDIDGPDEKSKVATIMMSTSNTVFVSRDNIYITHVDYQERYRWDWTDGEYKEKTVLHRLSLDGMNIHYRACGEVIGTVLNRYSMDEFDGYFRIATSTGWMQDNQVYVLDKDLEIVGELEDIAPGERIYSARFMGEKLYLVTFRQTDPFYVINLSDPTDPEILGELKIPGYSDYLHPYDANHIIGIGKEGNSVKISLFDVTDLSNPKELDKIEIGNYGSNSQALFDPHSFLFSHDRNMLVVPMYIYGDWNSYYGNSKNWAGAMVFHISPEDGIVEEARIGHEVEMKGGAYTTLSQYDYTYYQQAERAFYIGDVLYTKSPNMLKLTSLDDYEDIKTIDLGE